MLASCALAVVMKWPLVPHLTSDIPQELRDPLLQTWQVAWDGHALVREPLDLFDANAFWPLDDSLAFSDALIGYAPAAVIGSGPHAALIRYNLLFLFAFALAFAGAYLLARELGLSPVAAALAGAAFAYAPWRLAQMRHLHVISSGGLPLSLFLLVRGYRRGSTRAIVAGWVVAAWQLSLGITIGLQLFYVLVALGAVAFVAWVIRGRPAIERRMAAASAAGIVIFTAWAAIQAAPYLEVLREHPQARRSAAEVQFFSPPPRALLAAPDESFMWGDATASVRAGLTYAQEQLLFPGAGVLVLAAVGAVTSVLRPRLRVGLALAVVVTALLSLGLAFEDGRYGYRFLYEHAPGFQAIRTPGRITTLTTLALGILAGAGAQWLARFGSTARSDRRPPGRIVAGVLVAIVLVEGIGRLDHPEVPPAPIALGALESPQLHLPTDDFNDAFYMYWSTDGFPSVVNGVSGFLPTSLDTMRHQMTSFPDAASVSLLSEMGVRSVVLHLDRVAGTPWQDAAARSIDGLPLTRRDEGSIVIYELGP